MVKKHMFLRLSLWLLGIWLYKEVHVIFFIAGHTKHICDRLFKDLKKDYHKSDIFQMDTLINLMNKSDNVKCFNSTHDSFQKWDELFDKSYKKLESNTTNKNHIFSYSG